MDSRTAPRPKEAIAGDVTAGKAVAVAKAVRVRGKGEEDDRSIEIGIETIEPEEAVREDSEAVEVVPPRGMAAAVVVNLGIVTGIVVVAVVRGDLERIAVKAATDDFRPRMSAHPQALLSQSNRRRNPWQRWRGTFVAPAEPIRWRIWQK
jgi:hypothetical protein